MRRKKGFTLVELLVVIAIIALLMSVLMPALAKVRAIAYRLTCGTNLSGIGKAMMMYSGDYNEDFPRGGYRTSSWATRGYIERFYELSRCGAFFGFAQEPSPIADRTPQITVSCSLFTLVKFEELPTKQFVCKGDAGAKAFNLRDVDVKIAPNIGNRKIEDCWDFGGSDGDPFRYQPGASVSYAYQYPFQFDGLCPSGQKACYAVTSSSKPGTPVCSDRNPWLDKNARGHVDAPANALKDPYCDTKNPPNYIDDDKKGNCAAHQWEGQNVMYVDAHVSFEKFPIVGIRNDNIWKSWTNCLEGVDDSERMGCKTHLAGVIRKNNESTNIIPRNVDDAFLVGETNYSQ